MANSRGWGLLSVKSPGVGTQKEGKCPVHRQHCNIFHWPHSRVVTFKHFNVRFFVSLNIFLCNSAILIKAYVSDHQSLQWNVCAKRHVFSNLVEFVDLSNLRSATACGLVYKFFRINNIEVIEKIFVCPVPKISQVKMKSRRATHLFLELLWVAQRSPSYYITR